jgi:hypothetical protein
MAGKAEGQRTQPGHAYLQEIPCSEADESRNAKEIVGDDEGKVGGEEESSLGVCREYGISTLTLSVEVH